MSTQGKCGLEFGQATRVDGARTPVANSGTLARLIQRYPAVRWIDIVTDNFGELAFDDVRVWSLDVPKTVARTDALLTGFERSPYDSPEPTEGIGRPAGGRS